MADAAAARREARRRRILENSHNRLNFISGKANDDCPKETPKTFSFTEQSYENLAASSSNSFYLPPVNNGVVVPEAESEELFTLLPHQQSDTAGDTEIVNDLAAFLTPASEPAQTKSLSEKIVAYKYDVVILALIIQLLYSLYAFETAYFFLPLIMYTVTKLIWFPTESKSNIANAFLLMNGFSASKVQKFMNISQWVGVISQDVCVYLFTTICIQSLGIMLRNNVIT
ncbi:uncharacterized protein LOC126373877 [Pectinophora gossypiella]|uniref:uncharacterized protein LOC126373877 n=1 Tax=Pectinophora gossypiella TaxID=13191 RepID=UPI00214E0A6A|nr:uncharacterized protein LOC126373877 [Pectinophora gossypiella]